MPQSGSGNLRSEQPDFNKARGEDIARVQVARTRGQLLKAPPPGRVNPNICSRFYCVSPFKDSSFQTA